MITRKTWSSLPKLLLGTACSTAFAAPMGKNAAMATAIRNRRRCICRSLRDEIAGQAGEGWRRIGATAAAQGLGRRHSWLGLGGAALPIRRDKHVGSDGPKHSEGGAEQEDARMAHMIPERTRDQARDELQPAHRGAV